MDLAQSHEERLAELERERGAIANELGHIGATLDAVEKRLGAIEGKVGGRRWQDSLVMLTGPAGFSGKFQGYSGMTMVVIVLIIAILVARHFKL